MRSLLILVLILYFTSFTCSSQEVHRVTLEMTIEECASENGADAMFSIVANPIATELNVRSKLKAFNVMLYDSNSRMIHQERFEEATATIDCSNFSSGVYYVVMSTLEHRESYQLIIK